MYRPDYEIDGPYEGGITAFAAWACRITRWAGIAVGVIGGIAAWAFVFGYLSIAVPFR